LVTARHNNEEVFSTGSDPRLYNEEDPNVVGRNVTDLKKTVTVK
jgi:hypothetical protein